MQRYKILHRTYYNFPEPVTFNSHILRLRPREGPELRIESSLLKILPSASLRWLRDAEDNAVAVATFSNTAKQLAIESEVIVQQYHLNPFEFLLTDYANSLPFSYTSEDFGTLAPYINYDKGPDHFLLQEWTSQICQSGQQISTSSFLNRLCRMIHEDMTYHVREEQGVQTAHKTLTYRSGSCRDFANLFIQAARLFGLAARFVSGYLHAPVSTLNFGATHAWAEVFLPGAGWKGFDPTLGRMVDADHIAVAVASLPEAISPVEGSFNGPSGAAELDVGVWVSQLA